MSTTAVPSPQRPVDLLRGLVHHGLALLEPLHVVVPDDILHRGLLRLAVHLLQMEEALVPLRVGGGLQRRQQGVVLHGDQQGVAHLVLGGARVDAEAVDGHHGLGGVESLVLIVGDIAAVQGIGKVRAEAGYIEEAGAHADLLVRVKPRQILPWGAFSASSSSTA